MYLIGRFPKLKTTQTPIHYKMDKYIVVYLPIEPYLGTRMQYL